MGGVALLLWGLHMVLTGVLRAFGPNLRRFLDKAPMHAPTTRSNMLRKMALSPNRSLRARENAE
jgi:hypothetical protein